MFASLREPSLLEASQSQGQPGGRNGAGVACQFRLAEEAFGCIVGRPEFAARMQSDPSRVMRLHALGDIVALGHERFRFREDRLRLLGGEAFRPRHRQAVAGLQFQPLIRGSGSIRRYFRRRSGPLVRHLDRLAEMRDRLGERRAAQSLIAGLAPIFDRLFGQAALCEVMRQHFGLRRRALRELISQRFGGATMQCLTAALQQILVSRVLDQRVLEAISASGGRPSTKRMSASASLSRASRSGASSMPAIPSSSG